ncbi:MerR family transcriptional regulator [Pseudooceanicola nanhaiensis]|uniref:MerR family transcriptional regulator n=1 Tax=Pseudooceanicola nanhaiensis TaxID=375761 RepID=UPI001CD251E8|nr:MerR family transcriptional regulator [Pseudooceanicola nanhaiensis]MCA0919763.1 MerR family transcriptional regulator [Pseudooceanicola nanhaiensis]
MSKSADAFRTISEVADWLDTPAHVLRFWESKFTQVKPVKRAGGRRYYRPADMLLLGGIKRLLHEDGMTIKGVQKLLREKGVGHVAALAPPLDGEAEVEEATAIAPPMEAEVVTFPVTAAPRPAPVEATVEAPVEAATEAPAPAADADLHASEEPAETAPESEAPRVAPPVAEEAPSDEIAAQAAQPVEAPEDTTTELPEEAAEAPALPFGDPVEALSPAAPDQTYAPAPSEEEDALEAAPFIEAVYEEPEAAEADLSEEAPFIEAEPEDEEPRAPTDIFAHRAPPAPRPSLFEMTREPVTPTPGPRAASVATPPDPGDSELIAAPGLLSRISERRAGFSAQDLAHIRPLAARLAQFAESPAQ